MNESRVFITNLASTVTEESLQEFFKKQGFDVSDVKIPKDRETGKMKGFGFANLKSDVEVLRAVQNLAGLPFEGKDLRINKARPSEQRRPTSSTTGNDGTEYKKSYPPKKIFTCPHCGGQIEIVRKPFNKNKGYNPNYKKDQ